MNKKQTEEIIKYNEELKEKIRPNISQHIKNLLDKRLLWDYILDELEKNMLGILLLKKSYSYLLLVD